MPPDPLKEKDTNVEDMARFVLEFKDLITAECFEKIDAENQERERVKSIGKSFKIIENEIRAHKNKPTHRLLQ